MVVDHAGVPQMGAVIQLFDRHERLLGKRLTSAEGTFGFATLVPDAYSIRVTLASFFPAVKKNIAVQPGMQSLLNVNLASVFSSIELVYSGPGQVMSEEWKWVLRSASATRPVLRLLPVPDRPRTSKPPAAVFSGTRGVLRVSGGDEGRVSFLGSEPDLGTAFALATSFLGQNQLRVSGNVGYSSSTGMPSAGFRTSFRRGLDGVGLSPEVKLTMRQVYLPGRIGSSILAGQQQNTPALRTLSVTMLDRVRLTDNLEMEYGFSMDSVTFLDRLNYFSPFSRLTYDSGTTGLFQFSYSSGAPGVELFNAGESDPGLQQDIAALAVFPRLSLRGGKPRVQRAESFEIGYANTFGSRTLNLSAYRDRIKHAALTMYSDGPIESSPDLLPDMFSNSFVLNAGEYESSGFTAALTQALGDHLDVTGAYGSGSNLTAGGGLAGAALRPELLRDMVQNRRLHRLTAKVSGTLPATGTRFATSYQWASAAAITPSHMYLTQRLHEGLGWNLRIHQPIPSLPGWAGRLEATAELRNMLAQGYVPLPAGARRIYLVQAPRSFRGGLSFIF